MEGELLFIQQFVYIWFHFSQEIENTIKDSGEEILLLAGVGRGEGGYQNIMILIL